MVMSRRVLLVEDDDKQAELIAEFLRVYNIEVVHAESKDEAYRIFFHSDFIFDAVILNACVPGSRVNTLLLAADIANSRLTNGLIACSSVGGYIQKLKACGATDAIDKGNLRFDICRIFDRRVGRGLSVSQERRRQIAA